MNDKCPICGHEYNFRDPKVIYHLSYKPEITTNACRGCNYAEYLIHNSNLPIPPGMQRIVNKVKKWTEKNSKLI